MTDLHSEKAYNLRQRVWFYVCFDCNLTCDYCVTDSDPLNPRPPIPIESFRTILDEAVGLGYQQAAITGGEPFLHHNIVDIIEYSVERMDTIVLTNGTLLDSHILTILSRLPQERLHLQLSLDSFDPLCHDRHRGAGTWRSCIRALSILLSMGFDVIIRATITDQSPAEIEEMGRFLESYGLRPDKAYAVPVAQAGRSKTGIVLEDRDLQPEITIASDGIYRHPLKIAPAMAIAAKHTPLGDVIRQLAAEIDNGHPRQGFR